jgi:hypothetical protein
MVSELVMRQSGRPDKIDIELQEVRAVLEGLRNSHGCWCHATEEYEFKPPFVCGEQCQRRSSIDGETGVEMTIYFCRACYGKKVYCRGCKTRHCLCSWNCCPRKKKPEVRP